MKLDEIVAWYQKKIGLYDKQQWEQTVEQRILNGFSQVPLKNTKLKTELIDVDLVRGSTFPKAKPKQKLLTVLRLAILRYFFIPLYAKWWSEQTSPKVFGVLLFLYLLQMFNWAVYSYNVNRIGVDVEHIVSMSELIIPMLLSLILCVIHSQIVATSSSSSSSAASTKNNKNSIDKINKIINLQTKRKKRERIRRKKKNPRGRTPNSLNDSKTSNLNTTTTTTDNYTDTPDNKLNDDVNLIDLTNDKMNKENLNVKNDLDNINHQLNEQQSTTLRKRNVIWDSPIRSQVILSNNDHYVYRIDDETGNYIKYNTITEIDQQKLIHMSKSAQDFYNDICNRTLNNDNNLKHIDIKNEEFNDEIDENDDKDNNNDDNVQEQTGEDDGFESLNGKSSSGEDTNIEQRNYDLLEQINISPNHNMQQQMSTQSQQQQQQQQFNKNSRNTWIKDIHENNNSNHSRNSDSDTDTLSGLNINNNLTSRKHVNIASINSLPHVKLLFSKQQHQQHHQKNHRIPLSSESDMDMNSQRNTNKLSTILKNTSTSPSGLTAINNQLINKKLLKNKNNDTSDTDDENNDEDDDELCCINNYNVKKTSNIINNSNNNNNATADDDDDEDDVCITPVSNGNCLKQQQQQQQQMQQSHSHHQPQQILTDVTTSTTEWIGVTTNSEECSYSSEIDQTDSQNDLSDNNNNNNNNNNNAYEYDYTPTVILNPTCGANDRISCTIWDHRETKKAELSVLDISSAIIERVEAMPETCDYIYIGCTLSVILSFIPVICRLCEITVDTTNSNDTSFFHMPSILWEKAAFSSFTLLCFAFGDTHWERIILIISFLQRLCLTFLFFFLLAVAERTFKQRFLYAKLFSHLTSSRRAKKSELPHFRLNKVRNIKTWLSVRSYLKRRGPQRSVDVIVSAAFLVTLLLLAFLSVEYIKDSVHVHSLFNFEALLWSCSLGAFLLRFMTLGTKINRKYRSISVLITEQINLYLQIEQKPHKKEELMVANSVLKLAADLLKELESPFKISGLSANPYLYTTIKVVILSALSGVLSEMLGFKLKLHKIKIK